MAWITPYSLFGLDDQGEAVALRHANPVAWPQFTFAAPAPDFPVNADAPAICVPVDDRAAASEHFLCAGHGRTSAGLHRCPGDEKSQPGACNRRADDE